jgi:hypothetical protein
VVSTFLQLNSPAGLIGSDFNFVRQDGDCVPVGPETVPAGQCNKDTDKYLGSSGYRKIPGNTCDREAGVKLDDKVSKDCSDGKSQRDRLCVSR